MREEAFLRPTLLMLSGLVVWAAHFTGIYGFNALACARGFAGMEAAGLPIVVLGIGLATLLAVAGLASIAFAAFYWPAGKFGAGADTSLFMRRTTLLVVGLALIAVLWEALPALIIPPCA